VHSDRRGWNEPGASLAAGVVTVLAPFRTIQIAPKDQGGVPLQTGNPEG
jgi:hypothetical protein